MKTLLISAFALLTLSTQAFAGAYHGGCMNPGGGFYLVDGELTLLGQPQATYVSDISDIGWALDENSPEITDDTVKIAAAGKQKIYKTKNFKDECGNDGQEIIFEQKVKVSNFRTGEQIEKFNLVCSFRSIVGHCN